MVDFLVSWMESQGPQKQMSCTFRWTSVLQLTLGSHNPEGLKGSGNKSLIIAFWFGIHNNVGYSKLDDEQPAYPACQSGWRAWRRRLCWSGLWWPDGKQPEPASVSSQENTIGYAESFNKENQTLLTHFLQKAIWESHSCTSSCRRAPLCESITSTTNALKGLTLNATFHLLVALLKTLFILWMMGNSISSFLNWYWMCCTRQRFTHISNRRKTGEIALVKLPIAVRHQFLCHSLSILILDLKLKLLKINRDYYLQLFSSWPALKCWFHTNIKWKMKVSNLHISHFNITFKRGSVTSPGHTRWSPPFLRSACEVYTP